MSISRISLLFLAGLVLLGAGNWALPLIDRDEPRFAEASREMLERGDPIVPFFNGRERYDKPPLIYWLQCASYTVLGQNEFAARLPSVICAAFTACAIAAWGARIADPATGMRAALIFLLCLQTLAHGRAAVADMAMVLFTTVAAWSGWEWLRATSTVRRWWWASFWLSLALGFLAKGPVTFVAIGMTIYGLFARPVGQRPACWSWCGGSILMLGIIAAWGIPALVRTHGEFAAVGLGKHVVARSVVALEGHGARNSLTYLATLPLYFVTVFVSFAPWAWWLPAAARHYWRSEARTEIARYLLAGVVIVFGIFTLSRTKLPHYTLPAFPFLALLLALWWRDARTSTLFRRTAIATGAFGVALALVGFPLMSGLFPTRQLFRTARPWLEPEMEFASVDYQEPSLVWTFRRELRHFHESLPETLAAGWMARPGPRLLVIPTEKMAALFPAPDPSWKIARVTGFHFVKGRTVSLTLLVKPRAAGKSP